MKLLKAFFVILILIAGFNLGGCCTGGKEKETVVVPTQSSTPTLGKELEDLENAYKKGAITKEEYETAKKKLIEQGSEKPK
jgi:Short C-terminal domain